MIKSITLLFKILIYLISIPAFCMASHKISETERKRSRPVTKRSTFKKNKWILPFLVLIIVLMMIASTAMIFNPFKGNESTTNGSTTNNPIAAINTSMGTIRVEIYKDKVPNTANNFINLATSGFYDDLVFHRVIDNFMIQSGGFTADGTQKTSPYGTINLETSSDLKHDDGSISMARQGQDMTDSAYFNTATSQFFICDGAQHGLDNYYAVFGKVTEGMNVLRAIASVGTTTKYGMNNWPVNDVIINSITLNFDATRGPH